MTPRRRYMPIEALRILLPSLLVFPVLGFSAVQDIPSGPNKFAEAATYATYAEDAFSCKVSQDTVYSLDDAKKWTTEAIKAAKQVRTTDLNQQAGVSAFIENQKTWLATLTNWQKSLIDSSKAIGAALRAGKLNTAAMLLATLDASGVPSCDPIIKQLKASVIKQRNEFDNLVRTGDTLEGPAALDQYNAARRLNREDANLLDKIRRRSRSVVSN